ncbi:MAG: phosphoadenylyl-sulfate reductase [Cytophagales bacterium]
MNFEETKQKIEEYKLEGKRIFTTCSFQSHSLVLLHILSRIDKDIPVYFINTGFHFAETLEFRDRVAEEFGLKVISVGSDIPKSEQKDLNGQFHFTSDPDYCCHINKVQPMEPILANHDIWVNGVRADQSSVRMNFKLEQQTASGCVRFHPMLDWNAKMIFEYQKEFNLPKHPLEEKGYISIGCDPCTRKFDLEFDARQGRWFGMKKVECGLNTELA